MTATSNAGVPLLSVQGVTLQYQTKEQLFTATYRVSFDVLEADRFVVLGPSGCGKSTLLKAIGGYLAPSEGRILLGGAAVTAPGPDRAFVFQEFDQLLPWKTVRDNISFALTASGTLPAREATERAVHFIEKVGLSAFATSFPHTLSGGMKQRVAIARALAADPAMILADEPTAALDSTSGAKVIALFRRLADQGRAVVIVTHDNRILGAGDRIVKMEDGMMVAADAASVEAH